MKFDRLGNLYIADEGNQRIRKVETSGLVYTVAGDGIRGFWGDGGPATGAEIYNPEGIAIDICGNLYIADEQNYRIRKVVIDTPILIVPTISLSGITSASLSTSVTLTATVANAGRSYIIHWMNHGIEFTTTTVPSVSYTKPAGIDTITARVLSTATYGCYDSTTSAGHVVTADESLGFAMPYAGNCIVYPNPATGLLHICSSDQITTVSITSLIGQTVYSNSYHSEQVQVDVSGLPVGMYFVRINGVEVRKFIKK